MTLVGAIEALTTQVRNANDGQTRARDARGLQTRADEVGRHASEYRELAARQKVLRDAGISVVLPEKSARVARTAEAAVAAFRSDRMAVIEWPDDLRFTFWDQLGGLAVAIGAAQADAWRQHVQSVIPTFDRQLLEVLPTVTDGQRREFVQLSEQLQRLQGAVPADSTPVLQVEEVVRRLDDLVRGLEMEGISRNVRAFLRALSDGSATLAMVDPEVSSWLDQHGLTTRLRVRLGPER